ncbi:MAG TPA: hypothetical protein VGP46_13010, partial [Acidimicrobiales bacterium]|nr:hypothetical protein [Acidimicrobiales bacterium]
MTLLPAAPRNPVTVPPARLPGSVRRTSTMLMHWPDGPGTDLQVDGRARDLLTPVAGAPAVVSEDTLAVTVGSDRAIRVVSSRPPRQGLDALVGGQGGSRLRSAIESAVPAERQAGTALYLLLDDLAGCTLIAGFAWARWREALMPRDDGSAGSSDANKELGENIIARFHAAARARKMEGICAGFSPGASSLAPGGFLNMELPQNVAPVASVADPEDPIGW